MKKYSVSIINIPKNSRPKLNFAENENFKMVLKLKDFFFFEKERLDMGHCNTIFSYPSFLSCSFCKSIDNSSNGPKNLSWQWDRFIVLEKRQNNPFKFSDKAFSSISVLSHVSEEIEFEYCAYYRDPKNKKSILEELYIW